VRRAAARTAPRLSAAADPRDRRQRAGRRGDVGGARRADQGCAPVQAAVQRPVLGHRDPAHDGGGGAGPSAGAIVLRSLLARRRCEGRGPAVAPQFFDKLVAWGGESTIKSAKQYIGPGFELVAFDPKTSISLIGREAFESDAALADVAERAAADATIMNQQACASSRVQFVEGSVQEVDRYCALLQARLGVERDDHVGLRQPAARELRDEIDGLRDMQPHYRVWGGYEGRAW
jgi:hypothetical protein